jgi:hypothetical protein
MSTHPFPIGTKVRLTGRLWDGEYGSPANGTIVTVTETPDSVEPSSAGGFFWGNIENGPWYVDHDGDWAAEAVERAATVTEARAALEDFEANRWGNRRLAASRRVADALRDLLAEVD